MIEKRDRKKPFGHIWLPRFLIVLPGMVALVFIHQFAVNIPFWDQWEFIPTLRLFLQRDPNWLRATWHPHVSHRLFLPRLIFLGLASQSNWNVLAEIYLSYILSWIYLFILWMIYKRVSGRCSLWGFVPVAWLVFSLSQWENILWGWQVAIYLLMVCLTLTMYLLSYKQFVWAVGASAFAVIASLSFLNGLLIWPIGLFLLIAIKSARKTIAYWTLVSIVIFGFYFKGFSIPNGQSSLADAFGAPLATLQYFLANVGAAIGGANITGARLSIAMTVGIFLLCTIFFVLWHKFSSGSDDRPRISERDAILGGLLLFSLASSALIAIGRVRLGRIEWALSSRYITITSIGIISIYLFLLNIVSGKRRRSVPTVWFVAFLLLFVGGQILHTFGGYRMGKLQHERRLRAQYALRTISQQSDEALQRLYVPDIIRQHTPYLQEKELSLFAEEHDDLYLAAHVDGKLYGEITPGRPFVQKFTCPVVNLRGFGILFASYGRENYSDIRIILQEKGQIIWQQQVSTGEIPDNDFLRFSLTKPIMECLIRDLTLQIVSVNGSPGDAITVWTYPAYYDGRILTAPTRFSRERVLGLELNAQYSGCVGSEA